MEIKPSALAKFFCPKSVAIVGASADPSRIGGRPIAYMRSQGYAGRLYPINPGRAEIQGLRAYGSITALPEIPDVAIVALPADRAVQAIDELGQAGVSAAIVFSAGFAETGESGADAQAHMVAIAQRHRMRLLGPNSLGLFNSRVGYYATFSTGFEIGWPRPGRIAIASQSGAYGSYLFTAARKRGLGTPLCVTTGNEADLTIGEVIGWLANDPDTDVIAAYVEGIRSAESFIAGLECARQARKPIVMLKVGRSKIGKQAAQSHTAAVAGAAAVTDAILAEFGVIRARTADELLDIAHVATRKIYPVSNTFGVLTISGGAGILISDEAERLGLTMPPMPADAQQKLHRLIPFSAVRNPVDCTAQVLNDLSLIGQFADAVFDEGCYASVLAFFTHAGGANTIAPRLRAELRRVLAKYPDRLFVICILASEEMVRDYEADGMIVFEDPTRATVAIDAMVKLGQAFSRGPSIHPATPASMPLPDHVPNESEAMHILAAAGIDFVPAQACATAEEAVTAACTFGYPVVMKILSSDILHKSDIGGVALGVATDREVRSVFLDLIERARVNAPVAKVDGVLVARQVKCGIECIIGVQRDPVFGPMAMFGLGGVYVEIFKDIVLHRCPFGLDVAEAMIRSIQAAPMLLGARGRPPCDIRALALMLSRLSAFAAAAGSRLSSIDLNPVFAMPEGQGALAADVVIEIER
jgi:acyl-CoA synthetase (NDP forming)